MCFYFENGHSQVHTDTKVVQGKDKKNVTHTYKEQSTSKQTKSKDYQAIIADGPSTLSMWITFPIMSG